MSKQAQKKFKTSDGEPKPLETTRIESSLWLVKLPAYVADRWSKANQDEVVGNFMIGNKNGKRELYVQIPRSEGVSAAEAVPEMLVLNETTQGMMDGSDSMLVFSKDAKKDDHFQIDGKVTKRFNMKALDATEANNIIRARNKSTLADKREIQVASIAEVEQGRSEASFVDFGPVAKVEAKKLSVYGSSNLPVSERKLEDLERKFLEAFEKSGYMKKDHIITACLGPHVTAQDIQNLIDHYTKFHSSGRYKDHYELKAEFK